MAKRQMLLCLVVVTAGGLVASATEFAGGTGEPNSPYQITTAEQLVALGNDPNLWNKHFVLVRDLDMKGIDPNAMNPIGNGQGEPFLGVFDGGRHTISGLRIARSNRACVGLFGAIGGGGLLLSSDSPKGHVRNLHLRDITAQGYSSVGGLAGELGAGTISHCSVVGIIEGRSLVGGLVGWTRSEIEFCRTVVNISGDEDAGGLVGSAHANVVRCSSSGHVRGRARIGGLIGSTFAGGLIGIYELPEQDTIEHERVAQCRSDCATTGEEDVGGLIGFASGGGEILDCCATGPVRGSTNAGGLLGVASCCSVVRCFSAGQVTGKEHKGAFIGENTPLEEAEKLVRYPACQLIVEKVSSSDAEPRWRHIYRPAILSCFWDAEASQIARGIGSGADAQGGLACLMMAQMRKAASFRDFGWDFENVWTIREGEDYPRLRWEQQSPIQLR